MYYKPDEHIIFMSHEEVRRKLINIFFAEVIDDENLAFHGIFPVVLTTPEIAGNQVAEPLLPQWENDAWVQVWAIREQTSEEAAQAAQLLTAERKDKAAQLDAAIAAVYSRWFRFDAEYLARENAARAFAANGYQGDPGTWVSGFSVPAGLTNEAAANLIISQADMLRGALEELGALRMQKYAIETAPDVKAVEAVYNAIQAQVDLIAAGLQ